MNRYPISDERCDYNDDDWQPPPMCCPDIIEDGEPPACLPNIVEDSETLSDDSVYSDARLYEAEEKVSDYNTSRRNLSLCLYYYCYLFTRFST